METLGEVLLLLLGWILLSLGYVFTIGLLCVPFIRLNALSKREEGVDHWPVLYLMSLINALAWLSYGSLDPVSKAVIFINLIASVTHLSYTIWYMTICHSSSCNMCTGFTLVVVLLSFGIFACFYGLFPHILPRGRDSYDMGVMITAILMYLGPIPDTLTAMYNCDPGMMSVPIIVASLGNAFFWGEYGRVQGQYVIRMSNEVGVFIVLFQLFIYHVLRCKEIPKIYTEEIPQFFHHKIPQFFHQMTEAMSHALQALKNGYASLRGEEEEKNDD